MPVLKSHLPAACSGPIPDTMSQMSELSYIDLIETKMVGTVPEGYSLPALPSWLSLDA